VRKLLGWLGLAAAAIWILHDPATAAATIRHAVTALTTLISSL
jgi:hypothetical protein